MDGWDLAILVATGYLAIMALVRLMIRRRNQVVEDFRAKMARARRAKRAAQADKPREDRQKPEAA